MREDKVFDTLREMFEAIEEDGLMRVKPHTWINNKDISTFVYIKEDFTVTYTTHNPKLDDTEEYADLREQGKRKSTKYERSYD